MNIYVNLGAQMVKYTVKVPIPPSQYHVLFFIFDFINQSFVHLHELYPSSSPRHGGPERKTRSAKYSNYKGKPKIFTNLLQRSRQCCRPLHLLLTSELALDLHVHVMYF